jgi:hypothetical protein
MEFHGIKNPYTHAHHNTVFTVFTNDAAAPTFDTTFKGMKSAFIKIYLTIGMALFFAYESTAQKTLIHEHNKVAEQAKHEIDSLMMPGTKFQMKAAELKIKGEYIMDITVAGKGKILSVFMVASDSEEMKMQNMAKDLVRTIEFGFKVPKDKTYKFQYTFNFK